MIDRSDPFKDQCLVTVIEVGTEKQLSRMFWNIETFRAAVKSGSIFKLMDFSEKSGNAVYYVTDIYWTEIRTVHVYVEKRTEEEEL